MSDDRSLDLPAGHPLRRVVNRQAGILSLAQCRAAGLSAEAIRWRRITRGRWRRRRLGVLDLAQAARDLDQALGWLTRACGQRLTTSDRSARALRSRCRMRWRRELLTSSRPARRGPRG
ncbi:hypothetical protein ABGB07_34535 [Micromonosporaceae bacterium B7E4]